MKYMVPVLGLVALAQPALAFDRMTQSLCQNGYEKLLAMNPDGPDPSHGLQIQFQRVTLDGWCQIRRSDPGFEEAPFEDLEWRMDGAQAWASESIPPLALEIRARGFDPDEMEGLAADTDRPLLSAEIVLRQDPDAGLLILERFVAQNESGDSLSVSGVFERVFLSSLSMMQVSMGSATFKAGLLSMTLEGTHENPFAFYGDVEVSGGAQAQMEAAFDAISRVPDGVISDASRAELMAYAGDLPDPVGTLEVSIASERGLGLMQVGMAAYSAIDSVIQDSGDSSEMNILLDGVTIEADWSPAETSTD